MRTTFFVSLGLLICAATAQAAPLPGTPLSGTFGTIDITEPPEVSVSNPASQPFEFQPGTTACHGDTGRGDGNAGRNLSPPPGNLAWLSQMPVARWDPFM
jgi:hypothetical protein